jgi:hypothetical protein
MGRESRGKSTEAHKAASRRWYARNREAARYAAAARYHAKIDAAPDLEDPVRSGAVDTTRFRGMSQWDALALTLEK